MRAVVSLNTAALLDRLRPRLWYNKTQDATIAIYKVKLFRKSHKFWYGFKLRNKLFKIKLKIENNPIIIIIIIIYEA